jgi:rare lipoprotein A
MTITNELAGNGVGSVFRAWAKGSRLFGICVVSAALAACAQSPGLTAKSDLAGSGRQASLGPSLGIFHTASTTSSVVARKHIALATAQGTATDAPSTGVASYYSEGTETASGERFNPQELTAAHPNLPFGTHLRVTNLATGRSVVVRVNDRGPFVPGRSVDVSYSAAQQLGFLDSGTAKVKMEVVQ